MEPFIVVANPGSSSREYALFAGAKKLVAAYYETTESGYTLTIESSGKVTPSSIQEEDYSNSVSHFVHICQQTLQDSKLSISGIGLRLVAPGRRFLQHALLTQETEDYLKSIVNKAPLHLTTTLEQITSFKQALPDCSIFLISDSEFHKTISHFARNYAISRVDADLYDIYRFGYHGLSIGSVLKTLNHTIKTTHSRIIICHLGSGASITAVKNNQSIDTSMGYSPLEGLIMGTRSGNIDIEAALELKSRLNFDDAKLIEYLNHQSGLLGLSGISGDIRTLIQASEKGEENARFALEMMVYRITSYIGSYHAIIGGLDALVFTGTAGERSAIIRSMVCDKIKHLGVELSNEKNSSIDSQFSAINTSSSRSAIYVVPTDETAEIAAATYQLLGKNNPA